MKAIQNGQIVSIMGDRPYGFSARETTFMGEPVRFPYGTFSLAAAAQCPVVVLLSAKTGANRYLVRVARIIQPPGGRRARKEQEISAALREYAATLEEYVAEHPLQWFAFRDIWTQMINDMVNYLTRSTLWITKSRNCKKIRKELKEMIARDLALEDITPEEIADDEILFGDGLGLDSLDAVEIVVLLQRNFGVEIKNMEQGREIFYSIDTIANYIYDNRGK